MSMTSGSRDWESGTPSTKPLLRTNVCLPIFTEPRFNVPNRKLFSISMSKSYFTITRQVNNFW